MGKSKMCNEEFIEKAKKIHGNKYDYSKTMYVTSKLKVIIMCPVHGKFEQTPNSHLRGCGCILCGQKVPKVTTEKWVMNAQEVYGDEFDYGKVIYKNNKEKVCILHKKCGHEFWQTPYQHMKEGKCPFCDASYHYTTKSWIEKAIGVHGDKYDYSDVVYEGHNKKIWITHKKCGHRFQQTPTAHLQGHGCHNCYMNLKLSLDKFIEKARKVHGDKYDYSKVDYRGVDVKICIICPIHGEFWQTPYCHTKGSGCNECGKIKMGPPKNTTESWVKKAIEVHGDEYDYNKTKYMDSKTKVIIIHKKCGHEFVQIPSKHLQGQGCPFCRSTNISKKLKSNVSKFIEKARKIHGDKYDYSKVKYINAKTKVCIICPIHGEFWQIAQDHLYGCGCSYCAGKHITTEEFINRSVEVHGDKYDYSKVAYEKTDKKVCIICPEHGEFWQTPHQHLKGYGCPHCEQSKLERLLNKLLSDNGIAQERWYRVDWLRNPETNHMLELDFYLPEYNIAIECQGEQHFKPILHWGGEETFNQIIYRDQLKKQLCEKNGITLLYYSNTRMKTPYNVYKSFPPLLKEILKHPKNNLEN